MAPSDQLRRALVRLRAQARSYGSLLALAALALPACSGEEVLGDYPPSTCDLTPPPEMAERVLVSVASFWTADTSENVALKVLTDSMDATLYTAETQQMRTRVDTQQHIREAFDTAQLPDVFQVNGGSDVLQWVEKRPPEATDVCPLDKLRDTYRWDEAYFEATLRPLSCADHLYGLPIGVHNLNVLFYNRDVFAALKQRAAENGVTLTEPSQLSTPQELSHELELVASLNAVAPSGKSLVPLSIGTYNEWPLTIMAFENVLLGLQHDAYETLWMGGLEDDADGARALELESSLHEMVAVLRNMVQYSNAKEQLTWQEAMRQVGDGEALFTVTGDWGWAQLLEPVVPSVAAVTFPGTTGTFVYTPDSFAVPREFGKSGYAAHSFLHDVLGDREILRRFSNAKHSIPPRQDLDDDYINQLGAETLRSSYRRFTECSKGIDNCKLLLAVSGLGPPPTSMACFDSMDAWLTLAVTGRDPAPTPHRDCATPKTSSEAEWALVDLLLSVAHQRFAADCR